MLAESTKVSITKLVDMHVVAGSVNWETDPVDQLTDLVLIDLEENEMINIISSTVSYEDQCRLVKNEIRECLKSPMYEL